MHNSVLSLDSGTRLFSSFWTQGCWWVSPLSVLLWIVLLVILLNSPIIIPMLAHCLCPFGVLSNTEMPWGDEYQVGPYGVHGRSPRQCTWQRKEPLWFGSETILILSDANMVLEITSLTPFCTKRTFFPLLFSFLYWSAKQAPERIPTLSTWQGLWTCVE